MKRQLTDEALVAHFNEMHDRAIIDLMRDGDDDVWRYLLLRVICPVLRTPRIGRIVYDRKMSEEDVLGMFFEKLMVKKAIDQFGFRCPLVYWLRYWVSNVVLEHCRKNPNPVSDEAYLAVLKDTAAPERDGEKMEIARLCFRKLWKFNRVKASVHYLRTIGGLTARQVMKILHLSSEDNVNKIFSRACEDMRRFRDELDRVNLRGRRVNAGKEALDELS